MTDGEGDHTAGSDDSADGKSGAGSGSDAAESGDWMVEFTPTSVAIEEQVEGDAAEERRSSAIALRTAGPVEGEPETTEASIREAVLADVAAHFEDYSAAGMEPPDPEFVEQQWFDFSYLEDYEVVERYWVNAPFAYVAILYDPEEKRYRYHLEEPLLTDFEEYVRDDLVRIMRNSLMYESVDDRSDRERIFTEKARDLIAEHAATVNAGTIQKLVYYLLRDFIDYGRIDGMMRDPNIEDVSCDGVDVPVFVYHRGYRDLRTNVQFDEDRLNSLTVRLAQRSGKHISISDPLVDASLPDGSRIQLTLGREVSSRGSNFTIRKFSDVPYTPVDLIQWNTFSLEEMAYFWLAIENNKSLIFAGGTGSGKTTSMNAVSFFVPPDSKVVSIEDTREITLPHENWVSSVTKTGVTRGGQGEVTTYRLLQAALRQRPEYILVGEIRTEQNVALTFFQAIGTGHTAYTTVHADSVESALSRLQNEPLAVPAQMLQDLDIISIQRQVFKEDRRVRRNATVAEIIPERSSGETVATRDIYRRDPTDDTYDQVGDSRVLEDIARQRGWSDEELADKLASREAVLQYLVDEDVTGYREVAAVIETFALDEEYVIEAIEADDLEPERLVRERR